MVQLYAAARVHYTVDVMTRSDVQLMLAVRQGDEASFELLLLRYRTPLCHFLSRMVRDPAMGDQQGNLAKVVGSHPKRTATLRTGQFVGMNTRVWRL